MSRFDVDNRLVSEHAKNTFDSHQGKIQAAEHDLAAITRNIHAVHVTSEYIKYLKQNYHVLSDQYQACLQIAKGDQTEGGYLDQAFLEYCDKKQKKLFFKLKMWESAHPSLCEYRKRGCKA